MCLGVALGVRLLFLPRLDDDDEFIIQDIHSNPPSKSEPESIASTAKNTTENDVLVRGFHLWLQETRALSQQVNESSTNVNSTSITQNQPVEKSNDNYTHEISSSEQSQSTNSDYMIGIRTEKQIHVNYAYCINHPESSSMPSHRKDSSNDHKLQDDSRNLDSDSDNDSLHDRSKKSNSRQNNRQPLKKPRASPNSNYKKHSQTGT